jgi:hypothetical protein
MDHSGIQTGDPNLPIGCPIFQELEPLFETVVPVIRIITGRSSIHTTAKDPVKIDVLIGMKADHFPECQTYKNSNAAPEEAAGTIRKKPV